jgi:hypothetical protein
MNTRTRMQFPRSGGTYRVVDGELQSTADTPAQPAAAQAEPKRRTTAAPQKSKPQKSRRTRSRKE